MVTFRGRNRFYIRHDVYKVTMTADEVKRTVLEVISLEKSLKLYIKMVEEEIIEDFIGTDFSLIMHYEYQIILKRWLPILKEYERTKSKVNPRTFKFVKDLCQAHHISTKELRRYYVKWIQGETNLLIHCFQLREELSLAPEERPKR